ncbi:hypothetical protein M1N12_02610 [Peptococcaceae bacterium]|nr:hypothetical protein [Peptococcaceae bacterium]
MLLHLERSLSSSTLWTADSLSVQKRYSVRCQKLFLTLYMAFSDALNILAKKRKVRAHFIEGFWVDTE